MGSSPTKGSISGLSFFFFFLSCFAKVVLDLGCGTGILSLFCAKFGNAEKVGVTFEQTDCDDDDFMYRCML